MKIAAIDSDPSGFVSFFRGRGPFSFLARDYKCELMTGRPSHWGDIIQADVLVLGRPSGPDEEAVAAVCLETGVPLVLDYDDNYLDVPPWYKSAVQFRTEASKGRVLRMLKAASQIMFSTKVLCEAMGVNGKGCVIPNAWNDRLFNFSSLSPNRKIVSWRGGSTHDEDLNMYLPAMQNVAKSRPELEWWFWGVPCWRALNMNASLRHIPWQNDIFGYTTAFLQSRPWVHIVPLAPCFFNECKSHIAWMEATAAGALVVAPDWEEYRRPGVFNYSVGPNRVTDFEIKLRQALDCPESEARNRVQAGRDHINEHLLLRKVNAARFELLNAVTSTSHVNSVDLEISPIKNGPGVSIQRK
jgi:hypothetical protein